MVTYFPDTSALVKLYVNERGSQWLQTLLVPNGGNVVIIASATPVEIIAALTRRQRGGSLTPQNAAIARADFKAHLTAHYQPYEFDKVVRDEAMRLAEVHALRGYDAVQLATALTVNNELIADGRAALTLLSADAELNAWAVAEGLAVEDPNNH